MCVKRNKFSLYSSEKLATMVTNHQHASTCIVLHPWLIKKGFSMVPRAQQQQMPWFGRSQHDKQTKQNKLPSFIYGFNPWNVKFGLWFTQGRVGTRRVCWIGYQGGTLAT
jgi:hypothetical protein